MRKHREFSDIFAITEAPIPLEYPASEEETVGIAAIQQDIREMMYRIADLELVQSEQHKQHIENTKKLLLSLIEVMDAFDRVFSSIREKQDQLNRQMKKWIGNFRTIRRMLENMLAEHGVAEIQNLDLEFDPHWHKVGEIVEDPSKPEGTIIGEVLKGYTWHNQILRHAEVIVVRNNPNTGYQPNP